MQTSLSNSFFLHCSHNRHPPFHSLSCHIFLARPFPILSFSNYRFQYPPRPSSPRSSRRNSGPRCSPCSRSFLTRNCWLAAHCSRSTNQNIYDAILFFRKFKGFFCFLFYFIYSLFIYVFICSLIFYLLLSYLLLI